MVLRVMISYILMITTRIGFILHPYKYVFAIMEPSLYRILSRQCVKLHQISDPVDYYGIRTPYGTQMRRLLDETQELMGEATLDQLKKICDDPSEFYRSIDANRYLQREDFRVDEVREVIKKYGKNSTLDQLLRKQTSEAKL